MTNTTKQMAEEVIERLVSKELTFGGRVICADEMPGKFVGFSIAGNWMVYHEPSKAVWSKKLSQKHVVLGHPILLGDVLGKIDSSNEDKWYELVMDICCRWEDLGLSKSLQEILGEAIGECHGHHTDTGVQVCRDSLCSSASLHSPAADLFGFLHNIFITNK